MNQNRRDLLKAIGATGLTLTAVGTATANGRTRYLVTARGRGVRKRVEDAGFEVQHALDAGVLLVTGPADAASELAELNGVKQAGPDVQIELERPVERAESTTDEEFYPLQWDKQVTEAATAHETTTGEGATLAVIDTGVDADHPDLRANVDAEAGRLFKYGEVSDDFGDVDGHGTHVSGIAAASDDGTTGVVGMAPDATVVPLRVFYYDDYDGDGEEELTTTTGDILLAIDYAADLGVDAMNMSIGTAPIPPRENAEGSKVAYQKVIQSAIRRGSVVVVSAGNDDADLQHGGYFTLPNSTAGAMSISATGPNDERVFYSNYGTNEIDVGAPGGGYETRKKTLCADYDGDGDGEYPIDEDGDGEDELLDCERPEWPYPTNLVLSTVPPELYGGDAYAYFAGTSMAAPQVTGTVGLIRSAHPDAGPNRVETAIRQGADGVNGNSSPDLGAGRLDADGALDANVLK